MNFTVMRDNLIRNFNEITKNVKNLYEVEIDKDKLWNIYLDSVAPEANKMFRSRRDLDCSACRHFVRTIGNVVVITQDYKIKTIWDFDCGVAEYQPAMDAMDKYLKEHVITDIHVHPANMKRVGTAKNYETVENGERRSWDHFYVDIPDKFLYVNRGRTKSEAEVQSEWRDTKNVFKRSLEEITVDALETILELIATNTLYKGAEWKSQLGSFLTYKKEFDQIAEEDKDNYCWLKSAEAGLVIGRIRNTSIGTLLVNVSEGMDLDEAVRKYEQIVAPQNYKRSKAIFTKRMLDDAKRTIEELGYMESLSRRFARVDDISVNNILFCNRDTAKQMSGAKDIFGELEKDIAVNPKKFNAVEEVTIQKFISDALPTAREIELFLDNKHTNNMVSLIAPENKDSKSMFKWNNNFGWAYTGNITDSAMKERVKAAGGKVDGDLRFSIQWNDTEEWDKNDLDAHCIEPDGYRIYFGSARKPYFSPTKGQLDVDIIHPVNNTPAVENITWASRDTMQNGTYLFCVHCYCGRGGESGFKAEIEFDGEIYSFDYNKKLRSGQKIEVAEVTLNNGVFSIKELLPSATSTKKVWGVNTNQFNPVSAIMYSPNYWDEQNGIGNQHVFFMLKDCVNPENPNSIFNEYLKDELYQKHKRVFEALGEKLAVVDSENQLSGVGFSMTKRAEVIVKVKGAVERVLKIKF